MVDFSISFSPKKMKNKVFVSFSLFLRLHLIKQPIFYRFISEVKNNYKQKYGYNGYMLKFGNIVETTLDYNDVQLCQKNNFYMFTRLPFIKS